MTASLKRMDGKLHLKEFSADRESGIVKVVHGQEALSIYQGNDWLKRKRRRLNIGGIEFFHVARVPIAKYLQMQANGILDDEKETNRMLNRTPENKVTIKTL